jgi:hypothetical protein
MNSDKPLWPTHAALLVGGVDSCIMRANSKKINDNSQTRSTLLEGSWIPRLSALGRRRRL